MNKNILLISFLLLQFNLKASISDSIMQHRVEFSDEFELQIVEKIKNADLLDLVFEKLLQLEENKDKKINIVHIGDSHIQGDFFTNAIRQPLQEKFGNAGYGFTFPYKLANGSGCTKFFSFTSNVFWQSCRNNQPFKCDPNVEIGLCGYGFSSASNKSVISLSVNDDRYHFNTIKILTPYQSSCFTLAKAERNPIIQQVQSSVKYHKIKSGESLSVIAGKYKVSVNAIKNANNLKSNTIQAGKTLRIPTTLKETKVDMSLFENLEYQDERQYLSLYYNENTQSSLYLLSKDDVYSKNLSGIVLENDNSGLIYHSLGVVGSKASDFNKTALFFKQLPVLNPDLVILSFGTNESFGKISTSDFIYQMETLIANIKRTCPETVVMLMTPPTSLFRRRALNTYAENYSTAMMQQDDYPVWCLYSFTGGLMGARNPNRSLISSDNVHYTAQGYENQGIAFADDFLAEYEKYKQKKRFQDLSDN